VVGIGASAGGLVASEAFFRAMVPDSGVAFVLIQHLDPTHESLTPELLRKCTTMPVIQVDLDGCGGAAGGHVEGQARAAPPRR
jgi:two-component system, chemotaxis family, CheB/CheR fusion protein